MYTQLLDQINVLLLSEFSWKFVGYFTHVRKISGIFRAFTTSLSAFETDDCEIDEKKNYFPLLVDNIQQQRSLKILKYRKFYIIKNKYLITLQIYWFPKLSYIDISRKKNQHLFGIGRSFRITRSRSEKHQVHWRTEKKRLYSTADSINKWL